MELGLVAVACLLLASQAASQQAVRTEVAPLSQLPTPFKVIDADLQTCDSLNWGKPICLSGSTLVNVSWTSRTTQEQPGPANVIFLNPNASDVAKNSDLQEWCANITVVESRGLTLVGCNKTVDQVRRCRRRRRRRYRHLLRH